MALTASPTGSAPPFQAWLFVLIFVSLSAVFFIFWAAVLYLNARAEQESHYLSADEAVRVERNILEDALGVYAADLRVVAGLQSMRAFVNGNTARFGDVLLDFERFAAEKQQIAQLRFLDSRGMEVIRIDRPSGQGAITVAEELQDKSDRYYFQETSKLLNGGIYVSAMDLNVEFGVVEDPWRPTIRLATPLYRGAGEFAGIVVVNLSVGRLLASFSRMDFGQGARVQLLNADGYWLAGVTRDQLWGFMFGRQTTMAARDPEAWRKIEGGREGEFRAEDATVFFSTVDPATGVLLNGRDIPVAKEEEAWKLAVFVPDITLAGLWQRGHLPVAVAGLMVSAAIAYILTVAMIARRVAETSNQRAAAELMRNERMASLGSLVAGVAHELNTPVGTSITVASTLAERVKELESIVASGALRRSFIDKFQEDMTEGMRIIQDGLSRAQNLIGHFKQIAVDQTSEQRRHFKLEDSLKDVSASLQNQFRQGHISLETVVETSTEMDSFPGLLSQVLINLVENARLHAFAGQDFGKVVLHVWKHGEGYVQIDVRDNGCGIAPDVIDRIFEPFFSTRLGRGGSGLGLSIAYNIVTTSLGGSIRAESAVDGGTIIVVRLPVTAPAPRGDFLGRTYDA